ncbi:hypothetical protein ACSBR1_019263 [Camellia fascicularis]
MFISPNVENRKARELSNYCGITLTPNLGKYLGVPLLHSRVNSQISNNILEKIQQKLSNWKANNLSLAGRATVIQAVSSLIHSYIMQTAKLPQRICKQIDKINRNFLWGDQENRKKVHLVSWKQVCKAKQEGGLGLKRAEDQNIALLAKLGWKMLSDPSSIWTAVLKGKYLQNEALSDWPITRSVFHTWRSIIKTRELLKKGVRWTVGDGKSISIWHDYWCGQGTIAEQCTGDPSLPNMKVVDIIQEDGSWKIEEIVDFIPQSVLQSILQIHLAQFVTVTDTPHWKGATTSNFSVSAAYNLLTNTAESTSMVDWHWIWKLKIPQKLKGFCWLILHGRLLTNQQRRIKGLTTDDLCPRCKLSSEDLHHLLRECPKAKAIWNCTRGSRWLEHCQG